MSSRWFIGTLAAVAAFAATLALMSRLGHSLTVDEPFMANSARLSGADLFTVFRVDNVPFAYVMTRGWTRVFGESEIGLRSMSVLAYTMAVVVTGLAGRVAHRSKAGLMASTLMATSAPVGLAHAATARPYALLALLAAAATLQSLALLRPSTRPVERRRTRTALLGVTHLLGLFTHPVYAFFLTACVVGSLAVRRYVIGAALPAICALVVYAAVWGPVLQDTFALQPTSWMQRPQLGDLKATYLLLWGTGPGFILIGALVTLVLADVRRVRVVLAAAEIRWVLAATATAWLLPFVVSFWKPVFLPSRTPMIFLPLTAVLVGSLLAALATRGALGAIAALFLAAAATQVAGSGVGRDPEPSRASVQTVLDGAQCGDSLLAVGLAHAPVEYYLRRLSAPACVRFETFPKELLNWNGRMAKPDALAGVKAEASAVVHRLSGSGGYVWVFALSKGPGQEASTVIIDELRREMSCPEQLPLRGAFFDSVLRCKPR